ncbi:MAG: zinc-binding dehydrogenase, partial [Lachnospiraceae bacterium]|nr:zinc-binding dehydrogenase [Lachnospiraceae bacterium]
MKALIYYGPEDIRMEERPVPEAGPDDVIVKLKRAAICGSDITAYRLGGETVGIFPKGTFGLDGQFGHEMVGVVSSIGKNITDIAVGDRVFINPMTCKRNGMLSCDLAGAFSEYVLVEDAQYGNNLFKLQESVPFDEAVILEPLAVGTHGKNCVDVKPYEHVVVFGAGTIGLCTLNALLAAGVTNPVVVDLNEDRLSLAKEMGGIPFNSSTDGDLKEFIFARFGTVENKFMVKCADVDVYIDCAGAPGILDQVISFAKPDARVSIVAIYRNPIAFPIAPFSASRLSLKGSCGYDMSDI